MRVLRGVVYMTKSSGPRTEPWGTPQEDCQARKLNKEDAIDRSKWRELIKDVR